MCVCVCDHLKVVLGICLNFDIHRFDGVCCVFSSVAQFMYIIRRRINLPSEKAMFLFVNKVLPTTR